MEQGKNARPVHLAITKIQLPLPAVVSILHRMSGIGLFLGSLYLIFLLVQSLRSEESFSQVVFLLGLTINKVILLGILSMVVYHTVAGFRHLLMDLHIGTSLVAARKSSWVVLIITGIGMLLATFWFFL